MCYLCRVIEKTLLEKIMEVAVRTQTRLTSRAKPMKSKSVCELQQYNTMAYPKGYTIDEIREMGYDLLSELYDVDIRKL